MLLSASIGRKPFRLFAFLHRLGDHFRIGAKPLRLLDELATLDLEDLHPAAALVVGRGYLERWHQTAEAKVTDRFEALLDLFAGRLVSAIRLDRVAGRLDVKGGPQQATVVHDRVVH